MTDEINLAMVIEKLRKGVCRRVTEGRPAVVVDIEETERFMGSVADILALLSARPLALGGQKGDSETLRVLLDNLVIAQTLSKDIRQKATDEACSYLYDRRTTPARAEAQDEGAATDDLVDRFAVALKAKLRAAGEKYGFDDAWKADDWRDKLIEDLLRHIQKGDPRDVAAYCAFAWHHDWSLSPKQDDLRSAAFTDRGAEDRYVSQDEGAAGEPVAWPKTCDGIEQPAFEEWAKSEGFDMAEHPIHYLFTDPETAAARIAWKAGMNHAVERMKAAHPSPTPAADADRVRIAVEALEPFKLAANNMDGDEPDSLFIYDSPESTMISYGDLRRAASALTALKSTAAKEGGEV